MLSERAIISSSEILGMTMQGPRVYNAAPSDSPAVLIKHSFGGKNAVLGLREARMSYLKVV